MKLKLVFVWSALALLAGATACEKKSPTAPTTAQTASSDSPSVTDASTGITLTAPVPVAPADSQQFKFADQPIKLVASKAFSTGSRPLTYTFEIAKDSDFQSITFTRSGVGADNSGQASVSADKLEGAKNYYWRVRASSGSFNGLNSKVRSFNVGPEVVIQPPTIAAPGDGASLNDRGLLIVNNSSVTGPAGAIGYRFEVADSPDFHNIVFAGTQGEQNGQTSMQLAAQMVPNSLYFWRVQASDANSGVSSPYSAVSSFRYVPFDWSQATMVSSPRDFAMWGETAKVTSVVFTGDAFLVDFDRRTGGDRWPDVPFGSGNLQYTLGMCVNINNHWYCSAVVQFWFNRELSASGRPSDVSFEWFYDPVRWGPMAFYQPRDGELVGVFACAGNCRNNDAGDRSYVKERTNLALVPWSNHGTASYAFSGGAIRH